MYVVQHINGEQTELLIEIIYSLYGSAKLRCDRGSEQFVFTEPMCCFSATNDW